MSNLQSTESSVHRGGKRVGHEQGSGRGGVSTRGHKDARSRSGFSHKIDFEGGQMSLQRRVPELGFKNFNRKEYVGINLSKLQELVGARRTADRVNVETLVQLHIAKRSNLVKISGGGELKAELKISVHRSTVGTEAATEAVGGEAVTL